jgi:hypothetical protein
MSGPQEKMDGVEEGVRRVLYPWGFSLPCLSPPHKPIGQERKKDDDKAQQKLNLRGEALGVNDGHGIMFKKSSRISGVTAGLSEPVFQGSKRADPSAKFQSCRPKYGRKMNPGNPAPPHGEKSPEQDKDNEGEVDQKDQFSKGLPKHLDDPDLGDCVRTPDLNWIEGAYKKRPLCF